MKARLQRHPAAAALLDLDVLLAAVKGGDGDSRFQHALDALATLAVKEGIAIAIVGGLGAIHHGYERFTKDIDVVIGKRHLDALIRVAPKHGFKVMWHDPKGWHKLHIGGVDVDVVPEGGCPEPQAPTAIPAPNQLGVSKGSGYAHLAGWMETKLASHRIQDQADVVQVVKRTTEAALEGVRDQLAAVAELYVRRFDDLRAIAKREMERELGRGGKQ